MASTTANKKEIIDFLWDWAVNSGDWAKLLVERVVNSENNLSSNDREMVFNYFLQSINLYSGLQSLSVSKPSYTPTSKVIELNSISDITGVNRLAKNQTLTFSKNITVIYGENGTGKTGYSRILKDLGFSYDTNNKIFSNIYGSKEVKSAVINYKSNNDEQPPFIWDGINRNFELQNISVFNNSCVQISLSDRELIVSPIGFHLFNIISSELNELSKLLASKIALHPTTFLWTGILNENTPQHNFIKNLSSKSSLQILIELATFNSTHEGELKKNETELSKLNSALIQVEILGHTNAVQEIQTLIDRIESTKTILNIDSWLKLKDFNKEIAVLQSKTAIGIKEIAETNGIEFYATKEFQTFINAADEYIKIMNKPEYPDLEDTCIYCKQPLKEKAHDLLLNYRVLLNDKTQESLGELKKQKFALLEKIKKIDAKFKFHQSAFGLDEEQKPIQPTEISDYISKIEDLITMILSDCVTESTAFNFDYEKYLEFLSDKKSEIEKLIIHQKGVIEDIGKRETSLKAIIFELKDRKLLSTKLSVVQDLISNYKIISVLNSKSNSFSTNSISRKTTEAREQLVEQSFNELFLAELKHLRKSEIRIQLNFGTEKTKSRISHRLNNTYSLSEILSEGEQKAISLAEFLTELQLDNIKAPVIFDDPVNSLDHRIIDEVGKRLIQLSKQRQVIIFTHSVLLLNSLIQQSELDTNKQENVSFIFHKVKNNFGVTGILDEVEEINSYSYYTKKLQVVIDSKPEPDNDEAKLAAEGYGHLRSAIEITVEDDLLKKTIKRYKKGVAFPSLLRIDGSKIDVHKGEFNDIYEKCCVSIVAHSGAGESETTPKMEELKADYDYFKKLRKNFT